MEIKHTFTTDENGVISVKNKQAFLSDFKDKPNTIFIATFKKYRSTRSNKQNAFYWGNFLEAQIDCFKEMWGEVYSREQIHDWNKCNIWCDELIVGDEVFKIPQSSRQYNTIEWEERLDLCRTFFLNKFDWTLPYPNQQLEIDADALHNK